MHTGLRTLAAPYSALLLDLWGCVHDGEQMYPGALHCLEQLKAAGKRVLFLSNAPRRAVRAEAVLDTLGVPRGVYEGVLTSGEAGWHALARGALPAIHGTYLFMGPERDAGVLEGLPFYRVERLEEAHFLLNVGFGSEARDVRAYDDVLDRAAERGIPMLCLNPDLEVVKIGGGRFACAGVIAKDYAARGGTVHYVGKPHPEVYAQALERLGVSKEQVLAVGDGLNTDILGAYNAGIDSVLLTGGILEQEVDVADPAALAAHLRAAAAQPSFVLPGLVW